MNGFEGIFNAGRAHRSINLAKTTFTTTVRIIELRIIEVQIIEDVLYSGLPKSGFYPEISGLFKSDGIFSWGQTFGKNLRKKLSRIFKKGNVCKQ